LQQLLEDTKASTMQNSVRLHSLLRTLAPTASIGALMARLYQQLSEGKQENHSTVKTMLKEDFLKVKTSLNEQYSIFPC
jgi:hypothetical protein